MRLRSKTLVVGTMPDKTRFILKLVAKIAIVCSEPNGHYQKICKEDAYGQICAARQKEQERTEKVPRQTAENLGRHQSGNQNGSEWQGLQQEKAESE